MYDYSSSFPQQSIVILGVFYEGKQVYGVVCSGDGTRQLQR